MLAEKTWKCEARRGLQLIIFEFVRVSDVARAGYYCGREHSADMNVPRVVELAVGGKFVSMNASEEAPKSDANSANL
jgi:hypothetical protein